MTRILAGLSVCVLIGAGAAQAQDGRLMRFGAGVSGALKSVQQGQNHQHQNQNQHQNHQQGGGGVLKDKNGKQLPSIVAPNSSGQTNQTGPGGFANNPFMQSLGGALNSAANGPNRALVLQAQSAVQQVAPNAGQALSQFSSPVPQTPPAFSNQPIVLRCSSSAKNQCSYRLTEATGTAYPYTIAPGKKQVFNETTNWELSFDRGDGQVLRYGLSGGEIYELREENGLWVCYCAS